MPEACLVTKKIQMKGPIRGKLLFWISKIAASILAPGLHTMEGLQAAIRKNRAKGPALPPKSMLKNYNINETNTGDMRVFSIERRERSDSSNVLLYFHGGAMVLDLQPIQWNLIKGMVDHIDAKIFIPIFQLAPEAIWRETMPQILHFYLEVVQKYGAHNVILVGDSSGGCLAMLLAQMLRDKNNPLPAALVLYSPVLDLTATGEDQPALEKRDPSVSISLIRNAASLWAPDVRHDDPRVSPLYGEQSGLPPTIIFTGDREVLESDGLRLKAINPEVDHRSYAEMPHVFPASGLAEGNHALKESAAFIKS
ncbi:MAG: alpha/beta hydrolase fold domain-containing protein, partial [Candidatus Competibacteraceae bacterium]|nr:alpha/beta hydrolase fold domain-containing protein [Candidatus Competibacteraceae bacterium]